MSETQENRKAEEVVKEVTITNEKPLPPDIFGRERIAEQMCQLIVDMKAEAISPLALDGKWGSGKSVHAERMKKCFEDKHADKIKCIYWNASAEDYSENPLLSFIAFLYQHIEKGEKKNFGANSIKVLSNGLFSGILNLANQASRKFVGIDAEELNDAIQSGMKKAEDASNDIVLTQFTNHLDGIAAESARLKAAEKLLLSVGGEKELIIIIDELDRCRPDFALKMLESIKHLFATENCKFVLVMNKESMASSVEHLYGLKDEAAKRYLSKYIKKDFLLPAAIDTNCKKFSCTKVYFYNLLNEDCEEAWDGNPLLDELITRIIEINKIQLREVEKLVSAIKFIQEAASKLENDIRNEYFDCISCFIAYLLTFKQDIIMKIISGEVDTDIILSTLMDKSSSFTSTSCHHFIKAVLNAYYAKTIRDEELLEKYTSHHRLYLSEVYHCRDFFTKWLNYSVFLS